MILFHGSTKETFSQEDLGKILPSKIALIADLLAKRHGKDPVTVMMDFYRSKTYALLQNESTKYWWFSPAELSDLYERELSRGGHVDDNL